MQRLIAEKKWLECLKSREDVTSYLSNAISHAPVVKRVFKRMIGMMKSGLSKAIGNAMLKFEEVENILLGVQCFMNDHPLVYTGEEFDRPAITPKILIRGERNTYLEENIDAVDEQADVTRP